MPSRVSSALPETVGSSAADASGALQAAGLNPQVANEFSQTVPVGVVMDQLPRSTDLAAAPKKTSPWLWVAIVVAVVVIAAGAFFFLRGSQAEMVKVPDVVGMQQDEATTALADAGFQVTPEEAAEPGDAKEGEVVAQDPEAGGEAPKGSSVTISVVGAPEAIAVPDVVGLSEDAATAKLEKAGLRANPRTKEDGSVKPDTVIAQSPEQGTELAPDSRVDIIVAVAPAESGQVTVPDVSGAHASRRREHASGCRTQGRGGGEPERVGREGLGHHAAADRRHRGGTRRRGRDRGVVWRPRGSRDRQRSLTSWA